MKPEGYGFTHCLNEVVETVVYGLRALGHAATYKPSLIVKGAQNIVLGAHLCAPEVDFPQGTILYNLEPLGGPMRIAPELAKRYRVWDYSPCNLGLWHVEGIEADYVPIGYVPELTRIVPAISPDIDVLFYGSLSARRATVLQELQTIPGMKTQIMLGFGGVRDAAIARAKVVLNMHYADLPGLFEMVRVSYLLSNSKAVVSEHSKDFPLHLLGGVATAHYRDLAKTCRDLVEDGKLRAQLAADGFKKFSRYQEADILRVAISRLVPEAEHRAVENAKTAEP